jgi:hypothetical protein
MENVDSTAKKFQVNIAKILQNARSILQKILRKYCKIPGQ